jgi:hypothetical protein
MPTSEFNAELCLPEINGGRGFVTAAITSSELDCLRGLVWQQFIAVIGCEAPQCLSDYEAAGLENYHLVHRSEHFDHGKVWHKHNRILSDEFARQALQLPSVVALFEQLGQVSISDEEKLGRPNLYWRLVRPGNADIGPVHADKWFWDLGHGEMPDDHYRLKIWFSLYSTAGKSGLRVVPASQSKSDWRYHGERKGNMVKPVIDEPEAELDLLDLPLRAGQYVLFHDALLHGGMPNLSDKTRVSLEFTLLIKH